MTRRSCVAVLGMIGVIVVPCVWRPGYARPPGGVRDDVPPEVIANAEIARMRMERIFQAISVYANDNQNVGPPALSALYPEYIDDPLVFWHPGDTDPPPTTIDNDVPNAPNSARISFDVPDLNYDYPCYGNRPYIRDNSAANNGGLFTNEFWEGWYTVPPDMMPWPTATTIARAHLWGLVAAVRVYANDNHDWWPLTAMHYVSDQDPACIVPRHFWHPGDDQPMPTELTNDVINGLNSVQISFEYLVGGLNENYYDPNLAFWQDNSPSNNGGFGILVAYADNRVEFHPVCRGDATGDRLVDFADALLLFDELGTARTVDPWEGDLNGDSNADLADLALLQRQYGVNCVE